MQFEWDPAQEEANRRKHGLSFDDAKGLFTSGSEYLELFDDEHSDDEERFIAIGPIESGIVVVVWTERRHHPDHQRAVCDQERDRAFPTVRGEER